MKKTRLGPCCITPCPNQATNASERDEQVGDFPLRFSFGPFVWQDTTLSFSLTPSSCDQKLRTRMPGIRQVLQETSTSGCPRLGPGFPKKRWDHPYKHRLSLVLLLLPYRPCLASTHILGKIHRTKRCRLSGGGRNKQTCMSEQTWRKDANCQVMGRAGIWGTDAESSGCEPPRRCWELSQASQQKQ